MRGSIGLVYECDMPKAPPLRLGVNVDHVATLRNARGSAYPDPVRAAQAAIAAGADGITAHLREDRRHIVDGDIARLKDELALPLNFEMAATEEMVAMARRHRHHLLGGRHLEVERQGELVFQAGNVAIDDVPAILAQMRGDAV